MLNERIFAVAVGWRHRRCRGRRYCCRWWVSKQVNCVRITMKMVWNWIALNTAFSMFMVECWVNDFGHNLKRCIKLTAGKRDEVKWMEERRNWITKLIRMRHFFTYQFSLSSSFLSVPPMRRCWMTRIKNYRRSHRHRHRATATIAAIDFKSFGINVSKTEKKKYRRITLKWNFLSDTEWCVSHTEYQNTTHPIHNLHSKLKAN